MNYRRRPWCSDHRQLVTLLMTLLGKRTERRRQADRLVRLISKLMPSLKCNKTLSKISSPSICLELSGFPQNCFSHTLRTVWLSGPRVTGPHLASINTTLSVVWLDLRTQKVVDFTDIRCPSVIDLCLRIPDTVRTSRRRHFARACLQLQNRYLTFD